MRLEPAAGEALRAALGSPAVLRRLPSSPRSRVWLAESGGSPAIVKQITGGADADVRYLREVTALRLARRVRPHVVPGLLGTDAETRLLVLEYVRPGARPPGDWMTDYATALARLHAATGAADAGALPAWAGPSRSDARAFTGLAERLGVSLPAGLAASLDGVLERLDADGQHALLHGDPCPDNAVQTSDGIVFLDLEQAALGAGYTELAYLRAGFPTCWCATSVPGPVLRQAEAAYRSTWRGLTGADPAGDLADACAGWLIRGDALVERAHRGEEDQLARLPSGDWRWGTATARQRLLHRLTVVAALGADHPELGDLARVSSAMRERILSSWPDVRDLPAAEDDPLETGRRTMEGNVSTGGRQPSEMLPDQLAALGVEVRYAHSQTFCGVAERAARGGGRSRRGDRAPGARGGRVAAGCDPRRHGARAGQRRCDRGLLPKLGPPRQ